MNKEKKRVKIDEIVKTANNRTEPLPKRSRGRPRKNPEQLRLSEPEHGRVKRSIDVRAELPETSQGDDKRETKVEPIYDTTEESKAFLRAPFDVVSGVTGCKDIALYPHELDALAPSFKIVYDKRIAPNLGEHADLIAFGVVLSGVVFQKAMIYKDFRDKKVAQENKPVKMSETIETIEGDKNAS